MAIEHTEIEDKTDIEKLQDIMAGLPDKNEFTEHRKNALTKDDILIIYKIAKIAAGHKCPFEEDESSTLQSMARNVNRTQKLASVLIITAIVTSVLTGIGYMLRHIVVEFVHSGGAIK